MRKLLVFFIIMSLFLIPNISLGSEIEYYESLVNLNATTADYTLTFLFYEPPKGQFEYPLSFHIDNLKTSANFKNYECTPIDKSWGTLISCDFTKATEDGRAISMRFHTKESIKRFDKVFYFSTKLNIPENISRVVIKAVLDKGFVLVEKSDEPTMLLPYFPKDGQEGSDGRHIFVVWERNDLKPDDNIDVSVSYEKITPDVNQDFIFPLIGILIVIIAAVMWMKLKGQKANTDMNILVTDEKKIIEILKEHKGMCKQRNLVEETDFSKAKVSRLVKNLEERNIIKTEKTGRTKNIHLIANF